MSLLLAYTGSKPQDLTSNTSNLEFTDGLELENFFTIINKSSGIASIKTSLTSLKSNTNNLGLENCFIIKAFQVKELTNNSIVTNNYAFSSLGAFYYKKDLNNIGENLSNKTSNYLEQAAKASGKSRLKILSDLINESMGTYIAFITFANQESSNQESSIYVIGKNIPCYINKGVDGIYLSSDLGAIIHSYQNSSKNIETINGEYILEVTNNSVEYLDVLNLSNLNPETINATNWATEDIARHGFSHFMLKEVLEQPFFLSVCLSQYLSNQDNTICIPSLSNFSKPEKLRIIACGTSYHAGLWAKNLFEELSGISTSVELAAEIRYAKPSFSKNEVALFITQSGETADTLAALSTISELGVKSIGISNVPNCTLANKVDASLFTYAGKEVSIASTKALSNQMLSLILLGLYWAKLDNSISLSTYNSLIEQLINLPSTMLNILPNIQKESSTIAKKYGNCKNLFFLGRGYMYPLALEGSLKVKELTYLHAEGYSAGEVRHGPIALIDENFPSIILAPYNHLFEATKITVETIKKQKGPIILFTNQLGSKEISFDSCILFPEVSDYIFSFLSLPAMQLIGYELACYLNRNVDKPRNLTKSVQE